jgi:glycosyltransferase 2 family protein
MANDAPDGPGSATASITVIDDEPRRVRRPLDLLRVVGLLFVLAVLAGLGTIARDTFQGANADIARLLGEVPHLFIHLFSLVGAFCALALPIGLVGRELQRSHLRRLVEGLLTGMLAIGVVAGLNAAISAFPDSSLHRALTVAGHGSARPLDAYLAALFAFAVLIGIGVEPRWRAAFWVGTGLYVVSAFIAGQGSVLSLLASTTLGVFVATAVRYAGGSPNVRPSAARIAAELNHRGQGLVRIERTTSSDDYRTYIATDTAGCRRLVVTLDRDLVASGAISSIYRRLRLRSDIALPAAFNLERVAERRALLALAAEDAGVLVPRLLAGVACGPECIALAYEDLEGSSFDDATDAQYAELWRSVAALHRRRITHRGLTMGRLLINSDGAVVLPIINDGSVFATDVRIRLDRAQLLVATALMIGAERAAEVARSSLTEQELAACVPLLQPVALSRPIRAALKKHPGLLDSLRDHLQLQTPHELPAIRVERFRPRTVITIVAAIAAGYVLIGQLGSIDLATVFSSAQWAWVPLAILASAITYVAAAISLSGFVREKLKLGRTVLAQVASSFVGFITPPSVGGLAVNLRYLRACGLPMSGAATSVAVSQVVNAVLHALLLTFFAAATGAGSHANLPIPSWVFIALGGLAVLVAILLAIPVSRRWLLARTLPLVREATPRLVNLLSSPVKLAQAIGGTLLLNAAYIAALWFSVQAFSGDLNVVPVAVVYLAGAAVAAVAPTPGGLGAVEVTLSTGLTAAGMPGAAAVSAVLLYRIATYWLPVPVGWLAMRALEHRHAL